MQEFPRFFFVMSSMKIWMTDVMQCRGTVFWKTAKKGVLENFRYRNNGIAKRYVRLFVT